jgi:hypothetical protein
MASRLGGLTIAAYGVFDVVQLGLRSSPPLRSYLTRGYIALQSYSRVQVAFKEIPLEP